MSMAKSVTLKDREGNDCYPKTVYSNIIGLAYVTDNGVRVYFGSGVPSTDATQFEDIDENSLYFDTSLENKSAMLYRVDSLSNNVITWDPYKYIADANIQILGNKISFVSGYSIDEEVTYDETGTGLINHTTGNIDLTTSQYVYRKKAVSLNDIYIINGLYTNYNQSYSALTYLDADGNVIGYYPTNRQTESSKYIRQHLITIEDPNIAYIVVNGSDNYGTNSRICNGSIIEFDNYINKSTSFLADKPTFLEDTELATDLRPGAINWTSGQINNPTSTTSQYATINNVSVGEAYYITGRWANYGNYYRAITILDNLGNVLDTYPNDYSELPENGELRDFKYVIKAKNAAKMIINGNYTTIIPSVKKANQVSVEEYVAKTDPNYLLNFINMADMIKRVRAGSKTFTWGPFDTGYMTIVVDDGRHDLSTVSSLLNSYNIPVSAAIIPSTLRNIGDDNRTIKQVCDEIVSNGGEILAHEGSPLQSATDYTNIKRIIMDSKNTLVKAGFNIRGLQKPGGNPTLQWEGQNLQRFTQMFYDYADKCGDDDQYNKSRISLTISINSLKTYVNDAMTNNKWYVFFMHTLDGTESGMTEAHLREFIEYAQSQGIQFKTYAYMYDNFGNWN